MHISVKKTQTTRDTLQTLSDKLYSGLYADKGLTDFYYAFTDIGDTYKVNFEILGTKKQIAFLELISVSYEIVKVEPTEDGKEEEKEAINWWLKKKKVGVSSESEIIPLIAELIDIGRSGGHPGRFIRSDTRVREIGSRLDEIGGKDLMLTAHSNVNAALGPGKAMDLENAWHAIGRWLA